VACCVALQSEEFPFATALGLKRVGMLCCILVGGDPRTPLPQCARPHLCAWLPCARKRAECILIGRDPKLFLSLSLFLCYSHTFQHSAICMRRRIMLPYSRIHRFAPAVPKEQPHRVVVLEARPAAPSASAQPGALRSRTRVRLRLYSPPSEFLSRR
jgi:hypothetical protein